MEQTAPIAVIDNLHVAYPGRAAAPAVDGVSVTILPGETVGLVGESGSGKSTIARCLAGLQKPSGGRIEFLGQQLAKGPTRAQRQLRASLGYVFQDPATCLNPRMTVGQCVAEPLVIHRKLEKNQLAEKIRALLDSVALPQGAEKRYPHELSGGQRQRVGLARALALEPKLVIADEPTSALDVSVQATVLELFASLRAEHGFASLFITHDLAVVSQLCDRVVVLKAGKTVESGSCAQVLRDPREEYTQKLIAAVPDPQPEWLRAAV
ncbi:ABC transporter related protein [Segniliparus rotundus DSM 44985]|uniref:ABC transporter related protein n=1 Tax=Segniliparus rotundus (strain ATCC BAA-972 / CDC 1076 / CIP 108378 / DSM 44985 / JCM 13578) TaxID=640132 RepID=D6ZEH6_SEGRD|nr:ATP-binding cassette domain-containing protein [Segniliparus rotundus]ADG99452.1 ABC transporter related protein [Segniliparus rotundus DSM 44985]